MPCPESARGPIPNVPLMVVIALSLWGGIYLSATGLWPKRPAGPPVEAKTTQLANAPIRRRAKPVRRIKVAKLKRRAWANRSLAARTFATNSMH
jgi:hypothetical protein